MHHRRCPGCREYAAGGIRCRACGHRFCTPACLEAHEQGYHGLPPREPPLWFGAAMSGIVAFVCLFAAAVLAVGLLATSESVLKHVRDGRPRQQQQQVAPQKSWGWPPAR
jgi:hypothetical protein